MRPVRRGFLGGGVVGRRGVVGGGFMGRGVLGVPAGGAPLADIDATSGVYVPSTSEQWTALGLVVPDSLWLCQEASGNLTDSIGSLTLTATTTPQYQQDAAGWTRKGVGMTDGAGMRFVAAAAAGPEPTTVSSVWMYLIVLRSEGAAIRLVGGPTRVNSGTDSVRVGFSPSGGVNRLMATCDGTSAFGAADHVEGSYSIAIRYDHAAGECVAFSNLVKAAVAYSAAVVDGDKGIGGNTSADMVCVAAWMYSGAKAEAMNNTAIKATLQTLGIPQAWDP